MVNKVCVCQNQTMARRKKIVEVKAPKNVIDKRLYAKIKKRMQLQHRRAKKRWSAYSSSHLVREYKAEGGRYRKNKKEITGISRWHAEKWIDVCMLPKLAPCGRAAKSQRSQFPFCRPSVRVSQQTPKTYQEMTATQRIKKCRQKKK